MMALLVDINPVKLFNAVFKDSMAVIFIINIVRYFVVTVGFFYVLHIFFKYKKIQHQMPDRKIILQEIAYSLVGLIVLSIATLISMSVNSKFSPKIYYDFFQYSWWYHVLAFFVFVIYQDTYFYFVHRLLHTDFLYNKIHYIHHQYTNPNTFTFLAQHPLDLLLQSMGNFVFIYLLPMHPVDLFINSFFLTLMNVYGHSGFELYPSGFTKHRITKYFTTSTNHNMHHSHNLCNYGLWFTIWDRIFNTLHPDYDNYYEEVQINNKMKKQNHSLDSVVEKPI